MPSFSFSGASARRRFRSFRGNSTMSERTTTHSATMRISRTFIPNRLPPMPVLQFPSLSATHLKPAHAPMKSKPFPQSNRPAARRPQAPQAPCTAKASIGSSTPTFFTSIEAPTRTIALTRPMANAVPHSTLPQDPAMATMPPRMPLQKKPTSYFLMIANRRTKATRPPVAAESVVFIATCAARKPCSTEVIASVEPQWRP
mmetsp:Transcript_97423/g.276055  ORF Transcript_97423/g.276055 Transcript_97423/m.276055 type:complete len:201 (+) Transcript_97423:363-965(+)